MRFSASVLAVVAFAFHGARGFAVLGGCGRSTRQRLAVATMPDLTFTPPDTTGIEEQACIDAAQKMKRVA